MILETPLDIFSQESVQHGLRFFKFILEERKLSRWLVYEILVDMISNLKTVFYYSMTAIIIDLKLR